MLTKEVLLLLHGEEAEDPRMDSADRALKPWRLLYANALVGGGLRECAIGKADSGVGVLRC